MRETSGDQCPISGWQPPVAAGGGSVISGVVGNGDLLQSSAIHESAYRLKIGVPLALWLQRVGGAVADGRGRPAAPKQRRRASRGPVPFARSRCRDIAYPTQEPYDRR